MRRPSPARRAERGPSSKAARNRHIRVLMRYAGRPTVQAGSDNRCGRLRHIHHVRHALQDAQKARWWLPTGFRETFECRLGLDWVTRS